MKVSIYVSAEEIQVIGYDGHGIKHVITQPLPEQTMYNGTIIDDTILKATLDTVKNANEELFKGEVTLIVDGSSILSRKIATPNLSKKQYLDLIRDDFADSFENREEIVCGFRKHPTDESAILAFAVNKAQVDSYLAVFDEVGINLSGIRVGIEGVLNFVEKKAELKNDIVAFNIIDAMTMLTMIFVNGDNVFISRLRLYGDTRETILDNALENLNGLMQFTQSQKLGQISRSYYVGVTPEEIAYMEESNVHEAIQICGTSIFDGGGKTLLPRMHFCAFNTQLGSKNFNLIAARKELEKFKKGKKPRRILPLLLILMAVALTTPAVLLFVQNQMVQRDIHEIERFLESPYVIEKIEEIDLLRTEINERYDILEEVDRMARWENSLTVANGDLLNTIIFNRTEGVFVTDFSFNDANNSVRISASATDSTAPNRYISELMAHDFIASVDYIGFSGTGVGMFTFTLEIHFEIYSQEEVE